MLHNLAERVYVFCSICFYIFNNEYIHQCVFFLCFKVPVLALNEVVLLLNYHTSPVHQVEHCLDTDNFSHHITMMDHKRDNLHQYTQTVLPLLANNKKYTRQAIHTSFANRTIDNMTDNRVLNNRPSPINDKEAHLSRL